MNIIEYHDDYRDDVIKIAPRAFGVWTRLALDKTLPREKNEEYFKNEVKWYMELSKKPEKNIGMLIAEENGKAIGYIVVGIDQGRTQIYGFKWGHIVSLAVDPDHHGRGIGSSLIAAGLDWLRDNGVEYVEVLTDQNNIAAIRAYEKNNFRVIYSSLILSQYLR